MWDKAFATEEAIDIGPIVVCDSCNEDYTTSKAKGGFIFGSYAYCPECTPRMLENIKKYGEEEYIVAMAKPGQSFGDFIREYRSNHGGDVIKVTSCD